MAGQQSVTGCDVLDAPGTYQLDNDIDDATNTTCIDITSSNVDFDGQGNLVDGVDSGGTTGIRVMNTSQTLTNVTVRDVTVTDWGRAGVEYRQADNGLIRRVSADSNTGQGVRLNRSEGNTVRGNNANLNGGDGILLVSSDDNEILNNNASANDDDSINLIDSDTNEVTGNNVSASGDDGILFASSSRNNIEDNEVNSNGNEGIELTKSTAADEAFNFTAVSRRNTIVGNNVNLNGDNGIELDNFANNNTVRDNTALENDNGIELDQGANDNFLEGNNASLNNANGIHLTSSEGDRSNSNELTRNTVNDNGNNGIWLQLSDGNTLTDNTANDNSNNGIYLGGGSPDEADGNTLVDNTANNNGGTVPSSVEEQVSTQQLYGSGNSGIYLRNADDNTIEGTTALENLNNGIWLEQADQNNLTDNVARRNEVSGIYLGGISGFANDNTLVNNTATDSEYGIWIRNSFGNDVSESLAEDNYEGIVVEQQSLRAGEISLESVEATGNTFTDDTSRNNLWDFVVFTGSGGNNGIFLGNSVSDFPVTRLNIGDSTNPDTTLSFNADNMELRSVDTPESDPADATNIGRYFEAKALEGGNDIASTGGIEIAQTGGSFLDVSLSYENSDVSAVDESTLRLLRFNETASEWQEVPGSTVDTGSNLASANITQFSDFGVFGEGTGCINRRDLSRGEEDFECPFDRDVQRGGSREELDRESGRRGTGEHRDSATERRNRGRGN
ncbi:MAG: right-handed parallel beta-helix repeat-containing protein [Halobacteriales archaeon]|nr:right-handed parallel beta-helix repeat-containing protein [Halobacteriales archaeon]